MPVLGTLTDERRQLERKEFKTSEQLRLAAGRLHLERKERKRGDSLYALYQPYQMPSYRELEGKRIDMLWKIDGQLEWCQGKVERNLKRKKNDPFRLEIIWDAMPDVDGYEVEQTDVVEMNEAKWRKTTEFGWRLDLDVELFQNYYNVADEENVEECLENAGLWDGEEVTAENWDELIVAQT